MFVIKKLFKKKNRNIIEIVTDFMGHIFQHNIKQRDKNNWIVFEIIAFKS